MKKHLQDYVSTIQVFNEDVCNNIIQELETANWKTHTFYSHRNGHSKPVSNGKDLDNSFDQIPSHKMIMDSIWRALDKYIVKDLRFPWFPGWEGFTNLKFNRYSNDQHMAEHCDHIHDMFEGEIRGIPILTVLGSLNNDYEGGEFIMFEDQQYTFKAGEVIIFPSNFLYPHKVMPVTKGTRYTYISWVY